MIERYTLPEMGALWSEQAKFQSWLDVEIAATEAKERNEKRHQLLKATEDEGVVNTEESEDHLFRDYFKADPKDRKALLG